MSRPGVSLAAAFFLALALAACAGAYVAGDIGASHPQSDRSHPAGN